MQPKLYVLLENIRSAYNVGSIFRSCEAAGVAKLYLTGYTDYPPCPKLNKTALGSAQIVPWEHHNNSIKIANKLKKDKIALLILETDKNNKSIFDVDFLQNTCLVFGNEISGVSQKLISIADMVIRIPQFGKKESLNVAVAVGIAIYEFTRKRSFTAQ